MTDKEIRELAEDIGATEAEIRCALDSPYRIAEYMKDPNVKKIGAVIAVVIANYISRQRGTSFMSSRRKRNRTDSDNLHE